MNVRANDPPESDAHRQRQRASREAIGALIIAGIALAIALTLALGVLGTNGKVESQREGRRVAVDVLCGGLSAVAEAGRATITGSTDSLSPELTAFLERHGYPPLAVREREAEAGGKAYAKLIADAVAKRAKRTDLVDAKTGALKCERLLEAAQTD